MMNKQRKIAYFHVDAFSDAAFGGNPAAVFTLTHAADDAWMQSVAAEFNQAASVFLWPHEDPFKRAWQLRWFSPSSELALCGHGTIAASYVLWSEGILRPDQTAKYETQSGQLSAEYAPSGAITLDFPSTPPVETDPPDTLLKALGTEATYVGRSTHDYIVEVASAEIVRSLAPDLGLLKEVETRGVIVTAMGDSAEFDFISRFFAPRVGIPEDPVTGSAHCCLAPYWAKRLDKQALTGYQASSRGGQVKVALAGDRIKLGGKAKILVRGDYIA